MMINRTKLNDNISGKLNVFSFNPKTKRLENTLIDTASIKAVKTSMQNGEQINTLIYRTQNGVKNCSSINLFPDFTADKLKKYIRRQIEQANTTGNVMDVLL